MEIPQELLAESPDFEIVSIREFKTSQASLYRAFTDPSILQVWWGPHGFTNTFNEFDLRPGGKWSFVMHGNGTDYLNECIFITIREPELLAWDHLSPPVFKIVVTLDAVADGRAKLTFRMIFRTEKECSVLRAFVSEKNEENFDRLEVELAKMS